MSTESAVQKSLILWTIWMTALAAIIVWCAYLVRDVLLLIYVSGLMFVMRHFAGSLAHKLSPIGLLWVSCFLASAGLLLLSVANSPITGLLAATVWGTGVCYMWPTMLASASERFPRGGALLLGLMGTAGTLSIKFVLPWMGSVFDQTKIKVAGGEKASGDALYVLDRDLEKKPDDAILAEDKTATNP